jgi:hypothetical protein
VLDRSLAGTGLLAIGVAVAWSIAVAWLAAPA